MTDLLERQLVAVAALIDVDVGDRLVDDLRTRFDGSDTVSSVAARSTVLPFRRRHAIGIALGLAAATALVVIVIPDSRHAVANWFGIGSTRIERAPVTPVTPVQTPDPAPTATTAEPAVTPPTPALPTQLDLGAAMSVDAARAQTGLRVPSSARLGSPSGVFVVVPPESGQIVVVYPSTDTLGPTSITGVGALLSAVGGRIDDGYFAKLAGPGTVVETLTIVTADGETVPAIWLSGEPHQVFFEDTNGSVQIDSLRLATNTLLWTEDSVVYRLEASVSRDDAIEIARSVITTG